MPEGGRKRHIRREREGGMEKERVRTEKGRQRRNDGDKVRIEEEL